MISTKKYGRGAAGRTMALVLVLVLVGISIAACVPVAPQAPKTLDKIVWVSPRGTLEVMDDANLWAAIDQGYCKDQGIDLQLQPGPNDSLAVVKLVGQGQANIGYPSPGVLTSGIDAGIPVILAWEMMLGQVFDFAVAKGSPIKSVTDLKGKTVSLWAPGADVVVNPILVEAGLDPKSVNYVVGGAQWGQLVAQGKADAALAWRGLAAQWDAQGLKLDYLVGKTFSHHPSNGYAINKNDLSDPKKVEIWNRFFKCVAMGLDFSAKNPRAAAQITYEKFPALKEQMTPQLAFDSMWQLDCNYFAGREQGKGYGYANIDSWNAYIDTVFKLGQIKTRPKTEDVVTNQFVDAANKFDEAKVKTDADNFKLNDQWKALAVPSVCP
jgi:NitT/TauT family transport system substrate-binding protein